MRRGSAVYATPQGDTSLAELEAAVDDVIATIAEKGITAEELERAKTRIIADAVYARDNQATMARWYGGALVTGATVEAGQDLAGSYPRCYCVITSAMRHATGCRKERSVTGYLVKDWPKAEARRRRSRDRSALPASSAKRPAHACGVAIAACASLAAVSAHAATKIERVISPGGIEAWLVREPSLPAGRHRFLVQRRFQPGAGGKGRSRHHGHRSAG